MQKPSPLIAIPTEPVKMQRESGEFVMVNNLNHKQQQQQLQSGGVTLKMVKIKSVNGGAANGQQQKADKQEDEILEVNLIETSDSENSSGLGDFTEFLETGQLSDMVMRCSDGRFIECHRLVLAARARNLKHFVCGRNLLVTEFVFRSCVKFEHLQALINLIYRGHINGHDHQITSTLWKLFKIFGVRVTAKCFKGLKNGQKELAHQLKHDTVEADVEKGAMKFEKIIQEFRTETRRTTRRLKTGSAGLLAEKTALNGQVCKEKKTGQPGVIVISDEDDWSSASCNSSVSSLSSSSSEAETVETTKKAKQQQNGKSNAVMKQMTSNSNSALKARLTGEEYA